MATPTAGSTIDQLHQVQGLPLLPPPKVTTTPPPLQCVGQIPFGFGGHEYFATNWQGLKNGHTYRLESSTDLIHWFDRSTVVWDADENAIWTPTVNADQKQEFFRVGDLTPTA